MGRNILYAMVILGVVLVIAAIVAAGWIGLGRSRAARIPERVILEADFTGGLVEYVPEDPIAKAAFGQRATVRGTTRAIERAAEDERVVALIARVGTGFGLPAKVQELRSAIAAFRAAGKPTVAWVETFAIGYPGTTNYYLASAFDEILLLPLGRVNIAGLTLEAQFLRGALDKLGIDPQIDSRWEYKSARNAYTDTGFTEPHREALARIVESQFEAIATEIAADRGFGADALETLTRRGNFSAREALEAGLVDGVGYRDEAHARVRELAGDEAELLYLGKYAARLEALPDDAPVLALIYGVGGVTQGKSRYDPLSGSVTMGSDSVAAAFRQATRDDEVRAIVFRIDSGGGSAVASQLMWRETLRAREKDLPVVATMSDVAGSGGYFVAMGADKIVAQPGTITGSIGVLGGKLVTSGFWDKLGIHFGEVSTHPNASMWNGSHRFTEEQWALFQADLDDVYAQFTEGVASGRKLPLEQVQKIARGRIWTGSDALEIGLVDELGGFPAAIRLAKEAAGIAPEQTVQLRLFPRAKTPLQLILERLSGQSPANSEDAAAALLATTLEGLRPLGRLAAQLGLSGPRGEVEMPWTPALP